MSDDGCCGDTGGDCSYDTGGGCDDGGGCMETSPCTEAITYAETTFSDGADVHIYQPYEFNDGGYCYEDTYKPVYSSLSRSNNNKYYITDPTQRMFMIVIAAVMILLVCKLKIIAYVLKFLYVNLIIYN